MNTIKSYSNFINESSKKPSWKIERFYPFETEDDSGWPLPKDPSEFESTDIKKFFQQRGIDSVDDANKKLKEIYPSHPNLHFVQTHKQTVQLQNGDEKIVGCWPVDIGQEAEMQNLDNFKRRNQDAIYDPNRRYN